MKEIQGVSKLEWKITIFYKISYFENVLTKFYIYDLKECLNMYKNSGSW